MKRLILMLVVVFVSQLSYAQKVKWMSFEQAVAAQKKAPKPIFMDVFTDWCGPCKMLDSRTFSDPAVAKVLNANYYPVKFNAEGNEKINFQGKAFENKNYEEGRRRGNSIHDFTRYLGIRGYPSMLVITADGKLEKTIVGFRTAEKLVGEL